MDAGKAAGLPCVQLTAQLACAIFDRPGRPDCCAGLRPSPEMCGDNRQQALAYLQQLELATA